MTTLARPGPENRHVLTELAFTVRRVGNGAGDELHGYAPVTPHLLVPGTGHLRTSVLAIWTDTLAGLLAALVVGPRVPVTLELDVQLYRPAPGSGTVRARGRTIKKGRSVMVAEVDLLTDGDDEPFAVAAATFMTAHDPNLRLPEELSIDAPERPPLLDVPLAERIGCRRSGPGLATLPRSDDGLNAARTINGGLLAVAAEEAALSTSPPGATLSGLGLRYLQPARVGPVLARADVRAGLGRVEVRDTGSADRLCALATTRIL